MKTTLENIELIARDFLRDPLAVLTLDEPDRTSASLELRADDLEAEVVLKAEVTSGDITKIAAVELEASVTSGSALRLSADVIQIAGTMESADSLESDAFSAGSAGWQIKGNGDAEFNDVTVRGTLEAVTLEGSISGGSSWNEFELNDAQFKHTVSISVPSQGSTTIEHNNAGFTASSSFGTGSTNILGGNVDIDNTLRVGGNVDLDGLPNSDPGHTGRLWVDGNTLKVS